MLLCMQYTGTNEAIRAGLFEEELAMQLDLAWSNSGENAVFKRVVLFCENVLILIRRDLRRESLVLLSGCRCERVHVGIRAGVSLLREDILRSNESIRLEAWPIVAYL